MKGIVFVEFIEWVESSISTQASEQLLETTDLPSGGVYTSVGTYDYGEMVLLVTSLSRLTNIPSSELLKGFGRHLFRVFVTKFPAFFEGITSTFEFLPHVQNYVHLEVRKLYEDAELPTFECAMPQAGQLYMRYQSSRNMPDFAEGLILGCLEHFGERLIVHRETLPDEPPTTLFIISQAQ